METRPRSLLAAGGIGLAVLVVLAFVLLRSSPEDTARALAGAWSAHDWARMDEIAGAGGELAELLEGAHEALGVTETEVEAAGVRGGTATLRVTQVLGPVGEWTYETRVRVAGGLLRSSVEWGPSLLHPALEPGLELRRHREWPERAHVLGHGGPLTADGTLVAVGLEPQRITDREETIAALTEELDLEGEDIVRELEQPWVEPHHFVPLVRLREEPYQERRPDLAPIPGVVFRREPARLTPTEGFARHVLGRTREVTAERLAELGPPYATGDVVGLSGLELAFERRLAGTPAVEIRVVDASGEVVDVLESFPARDPEPLLTTIDPDVQAAAEEALAEVDAPAGLVAVDATGGEVRAVASRPLDEPFNRALAGRYPPGSTFKVVTAAAALSAGMAPERTIPCPEEITVGRPFRNAEGRALGDITLRTAFVESCNTAFVRIAEEVGAEDLASAAERFGFGATYELPLPAAGGRFPDPADTAELAAAGIGQGRVEASPLHMASVAAAVAEATWHPPKLLPRDDEGSPRSIDPDIAVVLRDWMRGVVREGTGTAAAAPGAGVAGKTGTAEFGTGDERGEHAWFVGFSGSLAFAVLVEGGGSGGEVAAPIAARFAEGLL